MLFRIRVVPAPVAVLKPERRTASLPLGAGPRRPLEESNMDVREKGRTAAPASFYADPTLRPGDTVVTPEGVRILRQGSHYPFKETDFLSLAQAGDAPFAKRSALGEIERALKTPPGRSPADL